jgi:CobQ/CobB/MinD/ParA nucleotide binding domain
MTEKDSTKKNNEESKSPLKVLILVTGDKGGTGKSTFARGLLDVLSHRGVKVAAYDGDRRNSQLFRHYRSIEGGVTQLDVMATGGADQLLDDMESGVAPVMLVDLPAGAGAALEDFEKETGFLEGATELGYRVSLVSVLSPVRDSVNALRVLMDALGEQANYVAVKNLHFGSDAQFELFNESKVKQELVRREGLMLSMPKLFGETYSLVDNKSLTFRMASKDLVMSQRRRVYQWLDLFEKELVGAGRVLGFDS